MSEKRELYVYDQQAFQERLAAVIGNESFRSFSQRANCSDTLLRKYLSGSAPSVEKAAQICSASGISDVEIFIHYFAWFCLGIGGNESDFLSPQLKTPLEVREQLSAGYSSIPLASNADDVVWIDSLDVFASAGNGFINDHALGNKLPFSQNWLIENGLSGKRLSLIRVSGDSMEPTLFDKETPLVELLPDDYINRIIDDVYVLRINGQLLIKRIQRYMNGGFLIKSDNPRYDSYHLYGFLTLSDISSLLDRKPESLRRDYLTPMVKDGLLTLAFPHAPTHSKQGYMTTTDSDVTPLPSSLIALADPDNQ